MNQDRITTEDSRLTAYALGELDAAGAAFVEAALCADPLLRAEMESIRRSTTALEAALVAETLGVVAETLPVVARAERETAPRRRRPRGRWIVFPQFYFIVGGLAAAGFAVLVAVNRDDIEAKERVRAENLRVAFERRAAGASTVVAFQFVQEAPETTEVAQRGGGLVLAPDFGEAAYANLRRFLEGRRLPPVEAVQPAELINALRYRFPEAPAVTAELVAAALEAGEVVVDFIVDTQGEVRNAHALRSSQREFEAAAVAAVSKWKFRPGRKDGRDVPTHLQVPVVFTLNQE